MRDYFEDYKELREHGKQFRNEHWLGTLVVTAISTIVTVAPVAIPAIKEKIKDHKTKKAEQKDSIEEN
jgi:hypothetical protein